MFDILRDCKLDAGCATSYDCSSLRRCCGFSRTAVPPTHKRAILNVIRDELWYEYSQARGVEKEWGKIGTTAIQEAFNAGYGAAHRKDLL